MISQTETDWEAIVLDDGNTDGTGDDLFDRAKVLEINMIKIHPLNYIYHPETQDSITYRMYLDRLLYLLIKIDFSGTRTNRLRRFIFNYREGQKLVIKQ